ncbi:transposase [Nocardia takedensis]
MSSDYPKYELLAIALDARFGNIYEYNLGPGLTAAYDFQDWTDELREAVRRFLVDDLPVELWEYLFDPFEDEPPGGFSRELEADRMVEQLQPGEVALMIRHVAVMAVPSLYQLIGHLEEWPSEEERIDADIWLTNHVTPADWLEMAKVANHPELIPVPMSSGGMQPPEPWGVVHALTPSQLLYVWDYVVGPAHSDFTDEEWQLLAPYFGAIHTRWGEHERSAHALNRRRRLLNAFRFRGFHQVQCTELPSRYGVAYSISHMYRLYHVDGLFVRLRQGLDEEPGALHLVAWLDAVIADPPAKRRRSRPSEVQPSQDPPSDANEGHSV